MPDNNILFNCPDCEISLITEKKFAEVTSECPNCGLKIKAPKENHEKLSFTENIKEEKEKPEEQTKEIQPEEQTKEIQPEEQTKEIQPEEQTKEIQPEEQTKNNKKKKLSKKKSTYTENLTQKFKKINNADQINQENKNLDKIIKKNIKETLKENKKIQKKEKKEKIKATHIAKLPPRKSSNNLPTPKNNQKNRKSISQKNQSKQIWLPKNNMKSQESPNNIFSLILTVILVTLIIALIAFLIHQINEKKKNDFSFIDNKQNYMAQIGSNKSYAMPYQTYKRKKIDNKKYYSEIKNSSEPNLHLAGLNKKNNQKLKNHNIHLASIKEEISKIEENSQENNNIKAIENYSPASISKDMNTVEKLIDTSEFQAEKLLRNEENQNNKIINGDRLLEEITAEKNQPSNHQAEKKKFENPYKKNITENPYSPNLQNKYPQKNPYSSNSQNNYTQNIVKKETPIQNSEIPRDSDGNYIINGQTFISEEGYQKALAQGKAISPTEYKKLQKKFQKIEEIKKKEQIIPASFKKTKRKEKTSAEITENLKPKAKKTINNFLTANSTWDRMGVSLNAKKFYPHASQWSNQYGFTSFTPQNISFTNHYKALDGTEIFSFDVKIAELNKNFPMVVEYTNNQKMEVDWLSFMEITNDYLRNFTEQRYQTPLSIFRVLITKAKVNSGIYKHIEESENMTAYKLALPIKNYQKITAFVKKNSSADNWLKNNTNQENPKIATVKLQTNSIEINGFQENYTEIVGEPVPSWRLNDLIIAFPLQFAPVNNQITNQQNTPDKKNKIHLATNKKQKKIQTQNYFQGTNIKKNTNSPNNKKQENIEIIKPKNIDNYLNNLKKELFSN